MHFHLCFLLKYYFVFAFVSNRDMSSLFVFFLSDNIESAIIDLTKLLLFDVIIWIGEASYSFFFYIYLYHPVLSFFDFIHSLDIISVVNTKYLIVFLVY
jgi:hypothetical protein